MRENLQLATIRLPLLHHESVFFKYVIKVPTKELKKKNQELNFSECDVRFSAQTKLGLNSFVSAFSTKSIGSEWSSGNS